MSKTQTATLECDRDTGPGAICEGYYFTKKGNGKTNFELWIDRVSELARRTDHVLIEQDLRCLRPPPPQRLRSIRPPKHTIWGGQSRNTIPADSPCYYNGFVPGADKRAVLPPRKAQPVISPEEETEAWKDVLRQINSPPEQEVLPAKQKPARKDLSPEEAAEKKKAAVLRQQQRKEAAAELVAQQESLAKQRKEWEEREQRKRQERDDLFVAKLQKAGENHYHAMLGIADTWLRERCLKQSPQAWDTEWEKGHPNAMIWLRCIYGDNSLVDMILALRKRLPEIQNYTKQ